LIGVYVAFSVIDTYYQRVAFENYFLYDLIGSNSYKTSKNTLSLTLSILNMFLDIFNTTLISYVVLLVKRITDQDKTVKLSTFSVIFHIAMIAFQAIVAFLYCAIFLTRKN